MLIEEYKPRTLKKVVGNENIIRTFKKYSKDFSFPPIMLMAGSTGTGKTTLANIVASTINCENPVKERGGFNSPCGECSSCKDIQEERFAYDVIVKDGSDLGIEGVKDLEREVSLGASYHDNKVIIIEESQQMASNKAIGALLKLLEKKRKNVYFILLSMDSQSLVKAVKNNSILDRMQVYNFKPHPTKTISDHLIKILEEIDPEEKLPETILEVISGISESSKGSIRGALQKFQRCLDSEIYTEEELVEELEIVTEERLENIIIALLSGDIKGLFDISKKDNLSEIFNQLWRLLVTWKKDSMMNSFYTEEYRKKVEHIMTFKNFDKLIDTFMDINTSNTSYFNPNNFYYYIMKFVETCKKTDDKPVSRRRKRVS